MIEDPPLLTIRRRIERPDAARLAKLAGVQTGNLVDAMDGRGALDFAIKPVDPKRASFVGPALTCEPGPSDNLAILAAIALAEPGDVIVAAEPYPEARKPAYKLQVDFGPEIGVKKSSAQCTVHYRLEELVGRQVSAVVNFPPKQIGKFMSEVLVLGFPDSEGSVVLVVPDKPVPNGGKLF